MWGSVRTLSLKSRALFLCLAFALGGASVLHAGGQPESPLAEAERLIQQQHYTDALKLLAAIQKENPDLRDETSRLMMQVMAVTQKYNEVLTQLSEARAAGDVNAMLKLVPQLQKIDPGRAPEVAQSTSLLVGFLKLMNAAQGLLAEGKVRDALALYLLPFSDPAKAGFQLPQKEFQAAGDGPLIVATVNQDVSRTVSTATLALKSIDALAAAPAKLAAFLGATLPADSAGTFDALTAPFMTYAGSEGQVRALTASLQQVRAALRQESDKNRDSPYLQYLVWLCQGRDGTQEGIIHAVQLLWQDSARAAAESVRTNAAAAFAAARARYESNALDEADAAFTDAALRGLLSVKAAALASAALKTSAAAGWGFSKEDAARAASLAAQVSDAQESVAESGAYHLLIGYRRELGALPVVVPDAAIDAAKSAAEVSQLTAARGTIGARLDDAAAQGKLWLNRAADWEAKAAAGAASAEVPQSARAVASLFTAFASMDLQPRDSSYALRLAAIAGSGFPARLDAAIALRKKGLDLRDGTVDGAVPTGTALVEKYPDQALADFATASDNLDSLITDITAQEQNLQGEKPWVTASSGYSALFNGTAGHPGYNDLLANARDERASLDTFRAAAQTQIDDAALASREGDNWFNQAQAALAKTDPDGATTFLDKSISSYIRSLAEAFSDHATTRTGRDQEELANKIVNLRSTIAVANAQKAIAQVNQLLTNKDFLGASDALDAAARDWSQSQSQTYPPFDSLRQNIQNAVELSQGRDISVLDPKADIVNGFIKNAQDNLAAGRLPAATQNVNDALAVAPNYGAAKILKLQIQKQKDPVQFQKDAAAQIAQYTTMAASTSVGRPADRLQRAPGLLEAGPKFATSLASTIRELEYSLNLVRRPPTASQIAQANALVAQADNRQQPGTPEAYQAALDLLKQAIQINPGQRGGEQALRPDRARRGTLRRSSPCHRPMRRNTSARMRSPTTAPTRMPMTSHGRIWKTTRNQGYASLKLLKKKLEVLLNIS